MAPGDYQQTEGKQRAVWVLPGGQIVSEGTLRPVDAVLVESGVAVIEGVMLIEDVLSRFDVTVPIINLPSGVFVTKTVAASWPASFGSTDNAESLGWAVDNVEVKVDLATTTVQLVIHAALLGTETDVIRYGYHVTLWLLQVNHDEKVLASLESA